jgi:hypothetical protein
MKRNEAVVHAYSDHANEVETVAELEESNIKRVLCKVALHAN